MKRIIPVIVFALLGYFLYNGGFDKLKEQADPEPEFTQIKKGGPVPNQLFGLVRGQNGIWRYQNGKLAYKQARVYQGGSRSVPNPVKRVDGCIYQKEPVSVVIDSKKYPASALHIYLGVRAGVPEILHINRDPGYDVRLNSLEGIPSNSEFDRDETPFALSNEAAFYNRSKGTSDIAYIPFSDNRGSGSSMGGQLSDYCDGQSFKINIQ